MKSDTKLAIGLLEVKHRGPVQEKPGEVSKTLDEKFQYQILPRLRSERLSRPAELHSNLTDDRNPL
jgi:hypothetical protein